MISCFFDPLASVYRSCYYWCERVIRMSQNCHRCSLLVDPDEITFAKTKGFAGYFCDHCEWFHAFDPLVVRPRYALFLEDASNENVTISTTKIPVKFKKQLSPLRYPGGKSKLIDYIYQQLDVTKCHTLMSPFAGGASVELALLEAGVVNHLILNDLDSFLHQFYTQAIYHTEQLIDLIHNTTITEDVYVRAHHYVMNKEIGTLSESEKAFYYLLNNRCSFSGIYKAGRMGGKNGSLSSLTARWNPSNLIHRLRCLASLGDKITLTSMDYTDFIHEFMWEKGTFLIDPPYVTDQAAAIYRHAFTYEQHARLFDVLNVAYDSHPLSDMLIFYDNHEMIQGFNIPDEQIIVPRKYSIAIHK